jgi:hypothetical protein
VPRSPAGPGRRPLVVAAGPCPPGAERFRWRSGGVAGLRPCGQRRREPPDAPRPGDEPPAEWRSRNSRRRSRSSSGTRGADERARRRPAPAGRRSGRPASTHTGRLQIRPVTSAPGTGNPAGDRKRQSAGPSPPRHDWLRREIFADLDGFGASSALASNRAARSLGAGDSPYNGLPGEIAEVSAWATTAVST